ncbi:MAG: hypothetical protein RI956_619 [Pseudomonadota bacterium]|jgi:hypothetical protein
MKKIILPLILLNLLSTSQAQMYLEMSLGLTSTALAKKSQYVSPSIPSEQPTMGSIGVGLGYKLHPNFAIVSKYQSLYEQDASTSSPKIRAHAISIRAVGIVPINSFMSVNAKIGIGRTKITVDKTWATNGINYGVGFDLFDKKNALGLDIDFYPTRSTGYFPALKQTNVSLIAKQYF